MNALLRPDLYWIPQSLPFVQLGRSVFDPNFPMRALSPFQAALGRRMLGELSDITSRRRDKARDMLSRLGDGRDRLALDCTGRDPVYPRLPLMAGDGNMNGLRARGVSRTFPQSLDRLSPLQGHLATGADCPGARRLAAGLVTVPTHQYLTPEDMDAIAQGLTSGLADAGGRGEA